MIDKTEEKMCKLLRQIRAGKRRLEPVLAKMMVEIDWNPYRTFRNNLADFIEEQMSTKH